MSKRRQFGKIRKLPSGRWQARYRDASGDEVAAPQTFPTKGEAGRFLAQVETEMARGEWRDPRLGRVTLAEWVTTYLDGAGHKRATTRARDEIVLRKHFLPTLGSRPIALITPLDIRRVVEAMAESLAPATVRTNYAVLKAVLNAAVEADLIVKSPCRGIRLMAARKLERPEVRPQDLDRLAAAMRPEYRPVVYVAGVLGLRWSEIAGLRVRHLDFLRRTLTVTETIAEVSGRLQPATTKSAASRRTLSVPPFLMAMLAEHLAASGRPGPDDLVFTAPAGGPLRVANFRLRVWAPAVEVAGLGDLTFHGLRHAAASFMVGAGEHPRVIQHRLGHSTARLSLELYAHVSEAADRDAAAHLDTLFTAAPAPTAEHNPNQA
ncbi:MAG TPA: tyrosine-type recombinase/integrase [Acidimicrobiia bacterium]|nr:tyrosine-type recombinase/integrase [Acidimicrobiia bacterium]